MQVTQVITASRVETTIDSLVIVLPDRRISIPWESCSPRLLSATAEQRQAVELSPGGYGIHWPLIDEDLSIGGLLRDYEKMNRNA